MISPQELANIIPAIKLVISLLVNGKYQELETLSQGVHLKAEYIAAGVTEYGCTLVAPPEEAFSNLNIIKVSKSQLPTYSVRFAVYTKEEGISDLSIELTLIEVLKEKPLCIEIDNIIVF
jgi:hypothetical protein